MSCLIHSEFSVRYVILTTYFFFTDMQVRPVLYSPQKPNCANLNESVVKLGCLLLKSYPMIPLTN